MIECKICKEYKTESNFVALRHGGYAICNECYNTPKSKEYREKMNASILGAKLKTQEQLEKEHYDQVGKYDKW